MEKYEKLLKLLGEVEDEVDSLLKTYHTEGHKLPYYEWSALIDLGSVKYSFENKIKEKKA